MGLYWTYQPRGLINLQTGVTEMRDEVLMSDTRAKYLRVAYNLESAIKQLSSDYHYPNGSKIISRDQTKVIAEKINGKLVFNK